MFKNLVTSSNKVLNGNLPRKVGPGTYDYDYNLIRLKKSYDIKLC